MKRNKLALIVATVFCSVPAYADVASSQMATVTSIQKSADEIAVLKASAAENELRNQMDQRKTELENKRNGNGPAATLPPPLAGGPTVALPPPVPAAGAMDIPPPPAGSDTTLVMISGLDNELYGTVVIGGVTYRVKAGDALENGLLVKAVEPTGMTVFKKGSKKKKTKDETVTLKLTSVPAASMMQQDAKQEERSPVKESSNPMTAVPVSIKPNNPNAKKN